MGRKNVVAADLRGICIQAEAVNDGVIAKVHQDPRNNDRKYLLKMAKKFNKSKFKVRTRYVHWLR